MEEIVAYQNDLQGIEGVKQSYITYPEAILQWNVTVEVVRIMFCFHLRITPKNNREMRLRSHLIYR